jgi:hypothetical protein
MKNQKPSTTAKLVLAVSALAVSGLTVYAVSEQGSSDAQASANKSPATSVAKNTSTNGATAWGANPLAQTQQAQAVVNQSPNTALAQPAGNQAGSNVDSQASKLPALSAQALAQFELPADFVPNNSEGNTEGAPFSRIQLTAISNGTEAIASLGTQLPAVAKWYGFSDEALRELLRKDQTVYIDRKGRLLNIDTGVNADQSGLLAAGTVSKATTITNAPTTAITTTTALDQTFSLHSKKNSTRVLFLNFKGQGTKPAFDLDKNLNTFSVAEQTLIQKVWQRVAEDYSAFDVDITTEAPTSTIGKIGATVVITNETSTAGGYAYINSFSSFTATNATAFCFQNNLANSEKPIAECISHELGHTLGLHHQSTASETYYGGSGTGETAWAPIMGVSYYKNLTQWAKGEYTGATNKEDAYAVMLKQGLSPVADDHGNTAATASALTSSVTNGLNNLSSKGVISTPNDVDMLSFSAGLGSVTLTAASAPLSANLDIALQLLDASGKVIATSNAVDTLGTTITANITTAGTYFLRVAGAGKGDPATTGYSNYGSIGQYSISGTAADAITAPPVARFTTSGNTGKGPFIVTFDASSSTALGSRIVSYSWSFGDGSAVETTVLAKHVYTKIGRYEAVLKITDARGLTVSNAVQIIVN